MICDVHCSLFLRALAQVNQFGSFVNFGRYRNTFWSRNLQSRSPENIPTFSLFLRQQMRDRPAGVLVPKSSVRLQGCRGNLGEIVTAPTQAFRESRWNGWHIPFNASQGIMCYTVLKYTAGMYYGENIHISNDTVIIHISNDTAVWLF